MFGVTVLGGHKVGRGVEGCIGKRICIGHHTIDILAKACSRQLVGSLPVGVVLVEREIAVVLHSLQEVVGIPAEATG